MKILQTATTLAVACGALASADKGFRPPTTASDSAGNPIVSSSSSTNTTGSNALDKFKKVKTVANFGKAGGRIEVCPSGDCAGGQSIGLSLSRLEEFDANGKLAVKAENFNAVDGADWGDFVVADVSGVSVSSTSYTAKLAVKEKGTVIGTPALNLTASIYAANGTAMNGNQSVSVPAGGLKFTLALSDWPFRATTNTLRFALLVKAKGNGTAPKALGKPEKKKKLDGIAAVAKIDRVDFGEGMFMDTPTLAVLDGVSADISASVETTASGDVEYVWVFPAFTKTLFYDPVVGSTDASAQVAADPTATVISTTATPTATPTVSTATPAPSSGTLGHRSVAAIVLAGVAAVSAFAWV